MSDPLHVAREELDLVWTRGDLAAIDRLYAPDCVDHNPIPGFPPGRDGIKMLVAGLLESFGNMKFTLDLVFADGERVARRWSMTAIHRAPFMGVPASGRPVAMTGIDLLRIQGGRITDIWHNEDVAGLMQQMQQIAPR